MQRDGVAAMPAVHRILLTATPLANNLPELYSLATLARPGALGTRDEFRDDFERPILAGCGMAAEMGVQRDGVFGIVTTCCGGPT